MEKHIKILKELNNPFVNQVLNEYDDATISFETSKASIHAWVEDDSLSFDDCDILKSTLSKHKTRLKTVNKILMDIVSTIDTRDDTEKKSDAEYAEELREYFENDGQKGKKENDNT